MNANLAGDVSPPMCIPPNIFMLHISELDDLFLWSSLHFGREIGHLGSDDLFSVFGLHYILGTKLVIWEVMTFFLVFTSLHFTVVGKSLGNRSRVLNLLNHAPQSRKMAKNGQFGRIIFPMLNMDCTPAYYP